MELISLKLFQTGTYNNMVRRPVVTSVNQATLNQLNELTHGGANVTRAAIAPVAAQIIAPSATPIGDATIANGWGETRCRFIAEFANQGFNGARMRKIVSGYTDHMGVIVSSNAIDPNMCLFINNVIDLNDSIVPGSAGNTIQTSVRQCDQILFGNYDRSGYQQNDYMLRPGDIFNTASSQAAVMNFAGEGEFADLRMTFMGGAARSRRDNLLPTAYLNRLMRASQAAQMSAEDNGPETMQYVNDTSAGIANDAPISGDIILRELSNKFDLGKRGFITWRDLQSRWPHVNAPGFVKVKLYGGAHAKRPLHQAGQSEHWVGNNIETLLATMLGNALPALLTDNMIYRIGLLIHNQTPNGMPDVVVTIPPMSLAEGVHLEPYVERLKMQLLTELMPGLTENNMRIVSISVNADVMDETSMTISVNYGSPMPFAIPQFGDQTFTLMTTNNMDHAYGIVQDITNLTYNLGQLNDANGFTPAPMAFKTAQPIPYSPPVAQAYGNVPITTNTAQGSNRWKIN